MSDNDEKTYRDSDDNPCTLDILCRREPEWAASRHRVMEARILELEVEVERKVRIATLEQQNRALKHQIDCELAEAKAECGKAIDDAEKAEAQRNEAQRAEKEARQEFINEAQTRRNIVSLLEDRDKDVARLRSALEWAEQCLNSWATAAEDADVAPDKAAAMTYRALAERLRADLDRVGEPDRVG